MRDRTNHTPPNHARVSVVGFNMKLFLCMIRDMGHFWEHVPYDGRIDSTAAAASMMARWTEDIQARRNNVIRAMDRLGYPVPEISDPLRLDRDGIPATSSPPTYGMEFICYSWQFMRMRKSVSLMHLPGTTRTWLQRTQSRRSFSILSTALLETS